MALSEDNKLDLLNDHYKDTFAYLREYLRQRDRLFIYLLVVIVFMLFEMASPKAAGEIFSKVLSKHFEITSTIDFSFMTGVIWFLMLGLTLRYYQNVILVERQYQYIHKLEDDLSKHYSGIAFTREGKAYLKGYPYFSKWADILYIIVFPMLLMAITTLKWVDEWPGLKLISRSYIFNSAIYLFVVFTVCLVLCPKAIQLFTPQKALDKSSDSKDDIK